MKRDEILSILNEIEDLELDKKTKDHIVNGFLDLHHKELDTVKETLESKQQELNTQLGEANKTIDNLKKNAIDPEIYKQEIDNYKNTIANLKKESKDKEIDFYVETKLKEAGAYDTSVCSLALDYDRDRIRDKDDYKFIDDAIKRQQKEKAFLFKSEEPKPKSDYNPRVGTGQSNLKSEIGKEFAQKLSKKNKAFSIQGVDK